MATSLTPSRRLTLLAVAAVLLAASLASAHVPPAPTTPSSPPSTPSSPPATPSSPPSTPPKDPSTPPATPSTPPKDPSPQTPPSSPTTPPATPTTPPADPPCCEVLKTVPGCKDQIYKAYTTISAGATSSKSASVSIGGSYVKLGSACCQIINTMGDGCFKTMYPRCPVVAFFRGVCSVFGAEAQKPSLLNSMQCLSALRKVPGCWKQLNETASLLAQFSLKGAKSHQGMHEEVVGMGEACCKASGGISDSCWQEMYPKYPAVPRVVKGVCSVVDRSSGGGAVGGIREAIKQHRENRKKGSDNVSGDAKEAAGIPVA